jgi:hypothetical protein
MFMACIVVRYNQLNSIFLYAQLRTSEKKSYCLDDNFMILLYSAVSLHDLLQEFFPCLQFLQADALIVLPQ